MTAEPTTIASAAKLLAHTLRRYGCDVNAIFQEAGLDPAPEQAINLRYPIARLQIVWSLAVEHTGDSCFGLSVAEGVAPQGLHGLGFSWLTSDTLFDAFNRVVRYQRLISTLADFSLHQADERVELRMNSAQHPPQVHPATLDAALGICVRMCRLALGEQVSPCCLSFRHSRPDCEERFEKFFKAPVEFDAEFDRLYFDRKTLQKPLPSANPALARANDQVVIDYLTRFDRESISMRARAQIIDMLPCGKGVSLKAVAEALNMSERNLQRKLRQEGCPFRKLLDDTRRDLASQYIREKYISIGEITYMLGFAEPSNFTRAFRRWTGIAPNDYRHNHVH